MAVKTAPKPEMQQRRRWGKVKFRAKGRCYLESALLEEGEQEITLFRAGAYRQRKNKNLELIEGDVPVFEHPHANKKIKDLSLEERLAFVEAEAVFIADLEDGDPLVGAAPGGLKLIKQG